MGWYDEGESGPPTPEDDAWYTHAVVSLGYPKVKRGDVPMEGQTRMFDRDGSLTKMSERCTSCGMEFRECLLLAATPMDETPPDCCADCSHG